MSERPLEEIKLDAGEYALGTLDDVARTHFEQALASDTNAHQALEFWEERLHTLGLALDPVEPPDAVWQRIEAGLDSDSAADQAVVPARSSALSSAWSRMACWRTAAVAASIVAVVLAALLIAGTERYSGGGSIPAYASMIRDQKTGTSWIVTVRPNSRLMVVRAMGNYELPEGKVLKAWIKPAQGEAEFVGQFPHAFGTYSMKLPKQLARALGDNARLMITMGDAESGNWSPSGTIMWRAPIVHRTS